MRFREECKRSMCSAARQRLIRESNKIPCSNKLPSHTLSLCYRFLRPLRNICIVRAIWATPAPPLPPSAVCWRFPLALLAPHCNHTVTRSNRSISHFSINLYLTSDEFLAFKKQRAHAAAQPRYATQRNSRPNAFCCTKRRL